MGEVLVVVTCVMYGVSLDGASDTHGCCGVCSVLCGRGFGWGYAVKIACRDV